MDRRGRPGAGAAPGGCGRWAARPRRRRTKGRSLLGGLQGDRGVCPSARRHRDGRPIRHNTQGACIDAAKSTPVTLTEERDAVLAGATDGLVLDRYRLGRRLGAGGFGAVHEAYDERLERWVAVKVIPADGAAPERARREAKAAARLHHPGIVGFFDAGEEAHARYLVSELVDGPTLAALEQAEALTDRDVLRIGLALCDALEHAHERGVVHRDVKPQNVLVPDK